MVERRHSNEATQPRAAFAVCGLFERRRLRTDCERRWAIVPGFSAVAAAAPGPPPLTLPLAVMVVVLVSMMIEETCRGASFPSPRSTQEAGGAPLVVPGASLSNRSRLQMVIRWIIQKTKSNKRTGVQRSHQCDGFDPRLAQHSIPLGFQRANYPVVTVFPSWDCVNKIYISWAGTPKLCVKLVRREGTESGRTWDKSNTLFSTVIFTKDANMTQAAEYAQTDGLSPFGLAGPVSETQLRQMKWFALLTGTSWSWDDETHTTSMRGGHRLSAWGAPRRQWMHGYPGTWFQHRIANLPQWCKWRHRPAWGRHVPLRDRSCNNASCTSCSNRLARDYLGKVTRIVDGCT